MVDLEVEMAFQYFLMIWLVTEVNRLSLSVQTLVCMYTIVTTWRMQVSYVQVDMDQYIAACKFVLCNEYTVYSILTLRYAMLCPVFIQLVLQEMISITTNFAVLTCQEYILSISYM